jgi:hypothetical protein
MRFENEHWQYMRDNIQFIKEIATSSEELSQMQVLKWLHITPAYDPASLDTHLDLLLSFYNELARKFLVQGRFQ